MQTYVGSGSVCDRENFVYSEDYRRTFTDNYQQFIMFHSLKLIALLLPVLFNIKDMLDRSAIGYALVTYLKYRCARHEEFDHERYLSINSDVKEAIKNRNVTDGLEYFMLNFLFGFDFDNTSISRFIQCL